MRPFLVFTSTKVSSQSRPREPYAPRQHSGRELALPLQYAPPQSPPRQPMRRHLEGHRQSFLCSCEAPHARDDAVERIWRNTSEDLLVQHQCGRGGTQSQAIRSGNRESAVSRNTFRTASQAVLRVLEQIFASTRLTSFRPTDLDSMPRLGFGVKVMVVADDSMNFRT